MHTWKARSYLPQAWANLWIRCKKGHLQMRSSVLIWYWQILQRATLPGQYLWGLFISSLFKNSLWGAFPPTVDLILLAGSDPTVPKCSTSATICTSCWVSMTWATFPPPPGYLPPLFSSAAHLVREEHSAWRSLPLPCSLHYLHSSHAGIGKATNQRLLWAFLQAHSRFSSF